MVVVVVVVEIVFKYDVIETIHSTKGGIEESDVSCFNSTERPH